MAVPVVILAALPAAVAAVLATAWWIMIGHDLDRSAGFFFGAWAISTALAWAPMRRRAKTKAAGTTFSVGQGGVLLPSGGFIPISGQYVLTRRNTAPYGQGAHAHRLDLDVEGVTYTLAGEMDDPQSMALYHEVGRRLRGDP
jgi:hypothetical protein